MLSSTTGRLNQIRPWLPPDSIVDEDLVLQRVYHWEKTTPERVFLTQPVNGVPRSWTWRQTMDEARRVASYLQSQNWEPGSRIVVFAKNCSWWIMAELAIWMAGHVTVPIYASLRGESVEKLFQHSQPVACFIGAIDDASAIEAIPEEVLKITLPTARLDRFVSWDQIISSTEPAAVSPVRSRDDLATIVYTSGTTGTAKGVMHRFAVFSYCAQAVLHVCGPTHNDRVISYLPLAHIAERGAMEANALCQGTQMFFAENLETFLTDVKRAQPTFFFSVPRLLVKFQNGVLEKLPDKKLSLLLKIPLLGNIVRKKILKELGLDHVRIAASGAAPLPLQTLQFFRRLNLNLVEGYGMTETGITHAPPLAESRPGTVGTAAPCVETKLDANGEILVRSPMNMLGYYLDPVATEQAFTEDGYFRTGDLGELDPEGWLKITGRVKELFKTSKGKYVSPATIEKSLAIHPAIENCCVMGSGLTAPFAVVSLSAGARDSLSDPEARAELERALERHREDVNQVLESHERLAFIALSNLSWTDKNGFLTPTMKVKRSVVERHYSPHVDGWVAARSAILWPDHQEKIPPEAS